MLTITRKTPRADDEEAKEIARASEGSNIILYLAHST
jgi:hypothetical protein